MELKDRVQQISTIVEELRQAAGDGRKSRALIDSLFRTVHSFKAAASAAGKQEVSNAAHSFEDLLQALRSGQISLDKHLLEFLELNAAGLLDGHVYSSFDSFTVTEIHKNPEQGLHPAEFATLRDEERHRATAAKQEGSNLYVMEALFEVSDFDERFRQLKHRLEEVAELISTSATMEDDKIIFQVIYAAKSEKIPAQTVIRQAVRAGNSAAATLGKQVRFIVRGEEFLLDRPWADALADALPHLVRNAIDHGIESHGTVLIESAANRITIKDDGRGISPQNLACIFEPGFSTAGEVTQISGRGVGLDVVKTTIENLGGSVKVTSEPGKGSSFEIMMPNPSSDA